MLLLRTMKIIFQFLFAYLVVVLAVFSFNYTIVSGDTKQLGVVKSQLNGTKYLQSLYQLSTLSIRHMSVKYDGLKGDEKETLEKNIVKCINQIYKQQDLHNEYEDENFNVQLDLIKNFQISEAGYHDFLNSLNHENYFIGDKSKLLFEEDRELYFLGSLVTHYSPEYLISTLLTHTVIEELAYKGSISLEKQNLFIEQNKLMYLSVEEIGSILSLLEKYDNTKQLESYFSQIKNEMYNISLLLPQIYQWKSNEQVIKEYIQTTHRLLIFSNKFHQENFNLIETLLKEKQSSLEKTILYAKAIFVFILITFSFLIFFYYRTYISNLKKDKEIKTMHTTLDKFVVFSKTDLNGVMTYTSSALEKLSGYSRAELVGQTSKLFRHQDVDQVLYRELWETILLKKVYTGEILNKAKDGTPYWIQATIIPELNDNREITAFSSYMVDITNAKALELAELKMQERTQELLITNKKLEQLSIYDSLTQIYNRLKIDLIIQLSYDSYKRFKREFSLILIDIDYFKEVNDTYGHLVGDKVIIKIARLIKENTRETDVAGRWGGEEFMIICEQTDAEGACNLAEKIRHVIEQQYFETVGKRTISLGIAQIEDNISIEELIQRADDALYYAKNNGRNKSIKYTNHTR